MPKSRFTGLAIAGVGVLLLTASLRELVAEAAPYIAGGVSSEQRFASLETGSFAPAHSLWSKNLFFLDCINAATDPFVLLERTEESRRSALQFCLDQANSVLAAEPSYAMAWLAKAVAASELGMIETMQSSLVEAWRNAPHLDWLAEQRIALMDRHPDMGNSPAILSIYQSDVRNLFASWTGPEFVARLYVAHEERRELITAVAETLPPDRQISFLSQVKTLTGGAK